MAMEVSPWPDQKKYYLQLTDTGFCSFFIVLPPDMTNAGCVNKIGIDSSNIS
jgi:predicted aspartyl protease